MNSDSITYLLCLCETETEYFCDQINSLSVSGEAAVKAFSFVSHFLKASFFQTKLSNHETVEGKGERKRQREAGTQKRIYGE